MAAPVSLSDMQTRVRELANMEAQFASDFVSDDEIRRRLNEGLKQVYDLLIAARGEEYYVTSVDIPLVTGTASYALPPDFYQGASVIVTDGSNFHQMRTWEMNELARMLQAQTQSGSAIYALRFRFQGSDIVVYPSAQSGWTMKLHYIPAMVDLVAAADTFNGVNGWEQYAVLTAAIGCLIKEESDATALMVERGIVETEIKKLAGARDASRASRIVDVRGDWNNFYWTPWGWNA